jgi:hypothetical protein
MYTIENKFGNDGYAFWFKLLEQLGAAEHHFLDCRDIGTWEFLLAIAKVKEDTAICILDTCSKLEAINQELWKYKIIRSDNFIKNLSNLYSRREIAVISNDEVLSLCKQKSHSPIVTSNMNPQRKVKDSEGDQSIKAETKQMEQEQEERIPKGNPRSSDKPADISEVPIVPKMKPQLLIEEESITTADELDQAYQETAGGEINNDTIQIKGAETKTDKKLKGVNKKEIIESGNKMIHPELESITDKYGWNDMLENDNQSESIVKETSKLENDSSLSQSGQMNINDESDNSLEEPKQAPPMQGKKPDAIATDCDW